MQNLQGRTGRLILLVGLVTLLTAGAGTALAQRPGGGPGGGFKRPDGAFCGPGDRGPGGFFNLALLAEKLDLSNEQSQAITAIQEEHREKRLELRKELMRLENSRQGELLKDDLSRTAVLELTERMSEIRGQMRLDAMRTRLDIREKLTREQRDQLMTMREDRPGRRGGARHDRPGREARGPRPNRDCPLEEK